MLTPLQTSLQILPFVAIQLIRLRTSMVCVSTALITCAKSSRTKQGLSVTLWSSLNMRNQRPSTTPFGSTAPAPLSSRKSSNSTGTKTRYGVGRNYLLCSKVLRKFQLTIQTTNDGWKGLRAGGCGNHPLTYPNNPRYQFTLDSISDVMVELKGPKQYQIGFDVTCTSYGQQDGPSTDSPPPFTRKSSGPYR